MNDPTAQNLQKLLSSGVSFQDATAKLLQEGYTQLQITDAKIQLDAGNQTNQSEKDTLRISKHPELATELLKATDEMAKTAEHNSLNKETRVFLPGGVNSSLTSGFHLGLIKGNVYIMVVGILVILIALFVVLKYML